MFTPQQEKGFRLLEKLIRTKYPWISKLEFKVNPELSMTIGVTPHVNLKRFVDQYDLLDPLAERFEYSQGRLEHFISYCWHYMYTIIAGSPINAEEDEVYGMFDLRLNVGIEKYMNLVYSKLPTDMTVKVFFGDPEELRLKSPSSYTRFFNQETNELEGYPFDPMEFSVSCYQIIPESCTGLLGGV